MEITWLGRNCFRLKGREGTVLMDPCPPESGYKIGKQAANVVTVSNRDTEGYSFVEAAGEVSRRLDAPGEYEVGGILVTGIAAQRADGSRNMIFVCELDGLRVAHLGLLAGALGPAVLNELKDIDILLMPVGGGNALTGPAAAEVMKVIDPGIVIPMNYKTDVETMPELEPLDRFQRETGSKNEPEAKITVSRSNLPSELTVRLLLAR